MISTTGYTINAGKDNVLIYERLGGWMVLICSFSITTTKEKEEKKPPDKTRKKTRTKMIKEKRKLT